MERQELIDRLTEMRETNTDFDLNIPHEAADNLLLEYINDEEITNAFNAIQRYYA